MSIVRSMPNDPRRGDEARPRPGAKAAPATTGRQSGPAPPGHGRIPEVVRFASNYRESGPAEEADPADRSGGPAGDGAAVGAGVGEDGSAVGNDDPGRSPGSMGARTGGSGSSIGGRSDVPVIRRVPRPWVMKLQAQRMSTTRRLEKPIRYRMWIPSQSAQAGKPLCRPNGPSQPMLVTPASRPITATSPRSL